MNFRGQEGWKRREHKGKLELDEMPVFLAWIFMDSIFVIIATMSASSMLCHVFPKFIVSNWIYIPLFFFAFAINLFTGIMERGRYAWMRIPGNFMILALVEYLYLHAKLKNAESLLNGGYAVVYRLVKATNAYLGTNFIVADGATNQITPFLDMFVLSLMLLLIVLAACFNRRGILFLWPCLVLIFLLCLGYEPGTMGLFLLAAGAMLSHTPGIMEKENGFYVILVVLTMVFSLFVGTILLSKPAEKLSGKVNEMVAFQLSLEDKALELQQEIERFIMGYTRVQDGEVSNYYPQYTGKEVMEILLTQVPDTNVHLRGSYGDSYKSGSWTVEKNFRKWEDNLMVADGISEDDGAEIIQNQLNKTVMTSFVTDEGVTELGVEDLKYELHYTGMKTETLYLPYGCDLTTMTEDRYGKGDYCFSKRLNDNRYFADVLRNPYLFVSCNILYWGTDFYEDNCSQIENYEYYNNYKEFVAENYLDLPKDHAYLTQCVEEAMEGYFFEKESYSDLMSENIRRIDGAQIVMDYLASNYTYSKNLSSCGLQDPVEYFLMDSHQGFCVHFASAATLMLREMGIPARYVTGYVVRPEDFKLNKEGTYTASIPDSRSHAWTEIYIDDVGWIPMEMTPASALETVSQEETIDPLDSQYHPEVRNPEVRNPEADPSEVQENIETESTEETESQSKETESQETKGNENEEKVTKGEEENQVTGSEDAMTLEPTVKKKELSKTGRIFLHVMGIAALVFLFVLLLKRRHEKEELRIERYARSGRYRQAAKLRHHIICREMKKALLQFPGDVRDAQMRVLLAKAFPRYPWDKYMQVIEKAVYGNEELEPEEYQEIKYAWLHIIDVRNARKRDWN